jgi:putative ABC transport system ATP-binding protein
VNPAVQVEGVTKRYRRGSEVVTAVDRATFELHPGTITALVGPSGSGKTTLLDLLAGGDEPDDGTIRGVPDAPDWSALAIVPQSLGLLDELTIGENISLPQRFGATPSSPVAELMTRLSIDHLADRSPGETSLGEQQRAAVARALLAGPALLVADEPTSHQDEANTFRVVDALAACAAVGSCVFLATHDLRVLERCDVVLAMRDGVVTPWEGAH